VLAASGVRPIFAAPNRLSTSIFARGVIGLTSSEAAKPVFSTATARGGLTSTLVKPAMAASPVAACKSYVIRKRLAIDQIECIWGIEVFMCGCILAGILEQLTRMGWKGKRKCALPKF
jgi:hypothetical protein